ncbi:MAG: carboxypeptidase regulatory-like domain-containing protein [Terracidiphilus sp.]
MKTFAWLQTCNQEKQKTYREETMLKRAKEAVCRNARRSWIMIATALMALGVSSVTLNAQDYRARLTVTVTDSTGALIPNATLELVRESTKLATSEKTDAEGSCLFQFLEPDTYSVKASAAGMSPSEVTGIVLQSYASTSVNVQLKPATTTAEVTVTSEGALLETESATRSITIDNVIVQALPVINGNPVMLGDDLPGVRIRQYGIYTEPWTVTSFYLINGGLLSLNDFQIDGSPNNATLGINAYAYNPPQFAVKEFAVSANNYDAQYGHTSGGVINLTTQSGGSKLHGMGWSSFRRTSWNSNSSQNKYENAINDTNANGTPLNDETQLGFQVGGPIQLPHVIPSSPRFKPYFFFAFDHYSELLPRGLLMSYPTAAMRTGDFSELLPYGVQIDDPETVHVGSNGDWVRDPFPGNIIPSSRLNPIALAVAKVFPAVGPNVAGQRPGTNNLNLPNNNYNWHFHNLLGRFDFNVGDKYKFFLRPEYFNFTEVSNAGGIVGPGENGGHFGRTAKGFLGDFVDTINPTTVLNVRYGYVFFTEPWTSPANQGFDLTSLGYPSNFANSLQQPKFYGDYNFQNYGSIGWFTDTQASGNYALEGDVVKSFGRQNVRAGWDVRLTHFTYIGPGTFTFQSNSDFTDSDYNDVGSEATSGDSFATFLLGTPSSGTTAINSNEFISTWYLAPWVQDDWEVNKKLTINFGLRYDVTTGPVDRNNALNIGFDPNVPNAVQSQVPVSAIAELPQAASLTGGLQFANVDGNSRAVFPTVFHNIQPRVGFAWQPIDGFVVRGGYGRFYMNFLSNGFINQVGFSSNSPLVTSNDNGITPIENVLNNPYPTGLIQPTGSSLGTLTGVGEAITSFNRNYKIPNANEFSLGFQYRLFRNSVIDASYVGNRVIGYDMTYDANLPPWNFQQQCDEIYAQGNASLCTAQQPNPFQGIAAFAGTSYSTSPTEDAYDLNRPHPEFQAVATGGLNSSHNWYNGLQVDYAQKMIHGISFNVSYVWSKQIEQTGYMNQALNIFQRSPYTQSQPHSFKVFGDFQLPVGRGKLVNVQNRVADSIVGGWAFSPDLQIMSGEPATLPTNAIPLPHNKFYNHPNWKQGQVRAWNGCVLDYVPGGAPTIPGGPTGVTAQQCGTDTSNYDWLEVNELPYEQTMPTNSSIVRMKPNVMSDAAIQKSFTIHEGIQAIVRLQSTNVLNHLNIVFSRFDNNPNDPPNLFGTIIQGEVASGETPPREVNAQFRVTF